MPAFDIYVGVPEHVGQFLDAVVGQSGDGLVQTGIDADDRAVGQVVVIPDDGFEKLQVFAHHLGDVVEGADVGDDSHQAASAFGTARGDQFHGKSSSRRLIL